MIKLNNLKKLGITKMARHGRGTSSGHGKTSGRGHKGQKSRSGFNLPKRFEGGQTSIIQKFPKKKGFTAKVKFKAIISINKINQNFKENEIISLKSLKKKKLIDAKATKVKILGKNKFAKKYKFKNCLFSKPVKKNLE